MSYLYHLKICFSNKFDALYNQNTILLVFVHLLLIGAVYRYYESRRRIFNDSQPCRRDKVLQVQENTRKKDRQKKVIFKAVLPLSFMFPSALQKEKVCTKK